MRGVSDSIISPGRSSVFKMLELQLRSSLSQVINKLTAGEAADHRSEQVVTCPSSLDVSCALSGADAHKLPLSDCKCLQMKVPTRFGNSRFASVALNTPSVIATVSPDRIERQREADGGRRCGTSLSPTILISPLSLSHIWGIWRLSSKQTG